MEAIGVLLMWPVNNYLEQELDRRFNLFRYWTQPRPREFLAQNSDSIRAVAGSAFAGADAVPKLEIVSSFSVGLDKIDLNKCREKGIRVTNTPDVADLALGLMLAVLRRICECDKHVRTGGWKFGDFKLTTRTHGSQNRYRFRPFHNWIVHGRYKFPAWKGRCFEAPIMTDITVERNRFCL